MRKKGFTLVELLAVIAILAILMLLAGGVFFNVRKNVLEGQYDNLILDCLQKAEDYAKDMGTTDVIDVTIDFLIKEGYILADDDDNNLYDPRDNTLLNCYLIHIILKDGEYVATLGEKSENEDGSCNNHVVVASELEIYCNGEKCSDTWYNEDLVLEIHVNGNTISSDDVLSGVVEWTSLTGTYEIQNSGAIKELNVSPENILDTVYTATLKIGEKIYTLSKSIKIDKELPVLISKEIVVDYEIPQKLVVNATDMSGSGLEGFAITSGACEAATYINGPVEVNAAGTFNLCMKDNAGNIISSSIVINKVTFNYNNLSNPNITEIPVYYLEDNSNYPLLIPTRPGYDFDKWVDDEGNRVYDFSQLENGDEVSGTWNIQDVDINVDKIDKNTVGVMIENQINMVLVLDVSGSMSGTELSNLQTVSNNLIDGMSFTVGSTISIISFESSASILLTKGTSASQGKSVIDSLSASGGTSFNNALIKANSLISGNLAGLDNNYVIFVSDGYDGDTLDTDTVSSIKSMVNTVYAIGIGSGADTSSLTTIASDGCYFNSDNGIESLSEIFTKIQDEIREEVQVRSENGLIELPNLYVTSDYPFYLYINEDEYQFPNKDSMSSLLTIINGVYYLDLEKVDIKYKLNGNLKTINFTYYYN